jgi:hypothetical protein
MAIGTLVRQHEFGRLPPGPVLLLLGCGFGK